MTKEMLLKKVKETLLSKNLFWDSYCIPKVNPRKEVEDAEKIGRLIIAVQNQATSVAEFMYNDLTGQFEKLHIEGSDICPDVLPPKMFLELLEGYEYVPIYVWYNKIPEKYTCILRNKIVQQWEVADMREEGEKREAEIKAAKIEKWKGQ